MIALAWQECAKAVDTRRRLRSEGERGLPLTLCERGARRGVEREPELVGAGRAERLDRAGRVGARHLDVTLRERSFTQRHTRERGVLATARLGAAIAGENQESLRLFQTTSRELSAPHVVAAVAFACAIADLDEDAQRFLEVRERRVEPTERDLCLAEVREIDRFASAEREPP